MEPEVGLVLVWAQVLRERGRWAGEVKGQVTVIRGIRPRVVGQGQGLLRILWE